MVRTYLILAICFVALFSGCADPADPRIPTLQRAFPSELITGQEEAELKTLSRERRQRGHAFIIEEDGWRSNDHPTYEAFLAAHELACRYIEKGNITQALSVLEQDEEMAVTTAIYRAVIYELLEQPLKAEWALKEAAGNPYKIDYFPLHYGEDNYFSRTHLRGYVTGGKSTTIDHFFP